jgi:ABC-type uncharacterized transport system permease subunit
VNYSVYFFREDPFARRTASPFLAFTAALHVVYIVTLAVTFRHHPMASVFEVLSVVALALTLVYLVVEAVQRNRSTGVFILPLVVLAQLVSSIGIRPSAVMNPLFHDPLFAIHTGTVTLAYSAFLLAGSYGLMFHLMYRALRRKQFGRIFERFPSLDVLARMTMGATLVGFLCLTAAIVVGIVWAQRVVPDFYKDAKFLLTLLVWVVYGIALAGHHLARWDGRRVVSVALVGFALMLLSFAAVNLFLPSFHQFGG